MNKQRYYQNYSKMTISNSMKDTIFYDFIEEMQTMRIFTLDRSWQMFTECIMVSNTSSFSSTILIQLTIHSKSIFMVLSLDLTTLLVIMTLKKPILALYFRHKNFPTYLYLWSGNELGHKIVISLLNLEELY